MKVYLKEDWKKELLPKLLETYVIDSFHKKDCIWFRDGKVNIKVDLVENYLSADLLYFRDKMEELVKPFLDRVEFSEVLYWKVPEERGYEIRDYLKSKRILNKLYKIEGVKKAYLEGYGAKVGIDLRGKLTPEEWEKLKEILKEIEMEIARFGLLEL